MRRTFEVRRETSEQPDGQDRWDQAYQLLLRWAATSVVAKEGAADASGVVRARIHRPAATGPDIEQQVAQLQSYVAAHDGWTVAAEHVFRDDGRSGAKLNRPGLDALRDHAARAAFDLVVICSPDRLARNFVHQMVVLEELERRGVRVVFCDRPLSDDPHEQLVTQIRGAVAEYERTLIADRMRRGRQARLRSGQLLPWTRAPYGYRLHPERPRDPAAVQVDPVAAAVVSELFAAYAAGGVTLHTLAAQLTARGVPTPTGKPIWRPTTIRGLLTNPAYKGQAASGRLRTTPARRRKSALEPIGKGGEHHGAPTPGVDHRPGPRVGGRRAVRPGRPAAGRQPAERPA
jgi:site-specific DNA recombinase